MELDNIQKEVVTSNAPNIIVSAGAGSGKTRVLTERIKYLLESGVRPDSIVAITFTNKAADEMKQRLYDVPGIGDAFIGTIHSFANKIFKNSGTVYELLTSDKEILIIKELINKYGKFVTSDLYMNYIDMKKECELGVIDEGTISDAFAPSMLYELEILYGNKDDEEYPENLYTVCSKRNIITFDQLLRECSAYFSSIDGKLDYLMVDELQDIGFLEYKFLMSLHADHNFFVGDDWQSIYKFKGGDVTIFLKLMEDPNWMSYHLKYNYRNGTNILDTAKVVINQADDIMDKEIVPIRKDPGSVEISTKYDLPKYLDKIKEDGNYSDWFILVRNNKDIVEISPVLDLHGIPHITFKQGGNSMESIDLKMALDCVKVLTVHSAKGLESKNVILYGNFPIRQKNYLKNSDERKVMYVGITRAKDNLIILN